ncbi:unnamed protein product [Pleuronectes platessa]|uniref:Uncharacterized protein n=1 Tax=Pleuronectes platessa TaxID=8262 RepID=A0A9N7TPH4_PLEPL|nr:unnamed protein product [Pleuronectes platessa]
MAQSPFVSSLKSAEGPSQRSVLYSLILPIWEPLHGERQILPIAHTPLTPTILPCPLHPSLGLPSLLLPPPPLHREGIYILIGRAAHHLRMRSMTVPSQLSLGTKQKAHQEQDGEEEEEAREGGRGRMVPRHSCSVTRPLDEVSARSTESEVNKSTGSTSIQRP